MKFPVPRVIGIVLLIIAALVFRTQSLAHTGLLALAGLVLVLTPKKSAERHWQAFAGSFKLSKDFALIMLFDALFWAALAVLIVVLSSALQGPFASLRSIQLGEGVSLGTIASYNTVLQGAFTTALVSLVVFWLVVLAAYSLSRGLVWLTLVRGRFQAQFFLRFALLNLCWCTVWLALVLVALLTMQPLAGAIAFIVLLLAYVHVTTVLHASYAKSRQAGESVRAAFGRGLGALGGFIIPYAYVFLVYVIIAQVQRLIPAAAGLVVTFLVFLAFMAWYRTYLSAIVRRIT